jgi:hypothetical protein
MALSRAARAFVLYNPTNTIVRQLLGEYQTKMKAALQTHGAMAIEVGPFDMTMGDETIYKDTDREKSLAFKLFRDGVRKVQILPQITWVELLQFLEILAVRYTGVRQQEDDTVTLIRKAELQGLTIEAVEGFKPAEENPEPSDGQFERANAFTPPAGWDTPLAQLPPPGPLAYAPIPEDALEAVRRDCAEGQIAELALSVTKDLLAEAGRGSWPMPNPDLTAFVTELRDGLLADGQLASVRALLDLLAEAGSGELREMMMRGLGDTRTLEMVLSSVPEDAARLPPDLVPFLPLLGIEAALDQLGAKDTTEARQRLLLQVILARLPREADAVLARITGFDTRIARELGRGIVARAPERVNEVARQFLSQYDDALRLEGLTALESAQADVPLRPIADLLRDPSERVRVRAAEVLARRGDASVIPALTAVLESGREVTGGEAEEVGRALAAISPIAAARLFAAWIAHKPRLLRGLSPEQRAQQWAAVAGMGALPATTDPEPALNALAARSDEDVKRHIQATLARRRREMRGPGPAEG